VWPRASVPPAAGEHRQIASLALSPEAASCRAARDFTTATLHSWDLDALLQDTALVASELVSNALRYGACLSYVAERAEVELIFWWRTTHLICVVIDASTAPPILAPTDLAAESGRGLRVVQAIARAWGWTMVSGQQKAVWASLRLPALR
jgi:two-component sensor histidine kinase